MIQRNFSRNLVKQLLCGMMLILFCSPIQSQTWKTHHSIFEDGDDYHFGYISGSVGYSMLQTSMAGARSVGNAGGSVGVGYEFRNSGLWVNVGAQFSFHRSKLIMDEYVVNMPGIDTQNKPAIFHYRVNQVDEMQWNYVDVPILVGYYFRGFHVGAGIKVSYALSPTTFTHGTYNLSATNTDYNVTFENMPDRGYTDYEFHSTRDNQLNVGASVIGEIGYDLLSSLPSRSRICHLLKIAFYFEYGLNNQLRQRDTPEERIVPASTTTPLNATQMTVNPYVNTFTTPTHTVPFFTGVKLTYMIGGSRTARVGFHHGCMCYN